jgi:hypothetical protein
LGADAALGSRPQDDLVRADNQPSSRVACLSDALDNDRVGWPASGSEDHLNSPTRELAGGTAGQASVKDDCKPAAGAGSILAQSAHQLRLVIWVRKADVRHPPNQVVTVYQYSHGWVPFSPTDKL